MPSSSTTSSATASSSASCCKIAQKCQLLDLVPLLMTMPVKPFDSKGGWHWQMLHVHHYHRRPHHHQNLIQIGMLSFKKVGECGKFSQRGRKGRSSKSHHFMPIYKVFFVFQNQMSSDIPSNFEHWTLCLIFWLIASAISNELFRALNNFFDILAEIQLTLWLAASDCSRWPLLLHNK